MSDFCLVRQPVFGTTGALLGYEILFHEGESDGEGFAESVASGTFDLVRNRLPAFLTGTRDQLIADLFHLAAPGTAIVMLPPDLEVDEAVTDACARYRAHGGLLALDRVGETPGPSEALLPYVSWARVDSRSENAVTIGQICDRITQDFGRNAPKLMAINIDELAQYQVVLGLGFDAFQGTFFSRPEPLPSANMPQSTVAALRLMGMASDEHVNDRQLNEVISTDPVLTFQLLRLVNSSAMGLRGVSSIGQALQGIGRTAFLRWLAVAVATSRRATSGVDQELVRQAVERGRLLEQLAAGPREGGTLFLVGLFSLLDAVFRMPLPEILSRVVLSDEANEALLHRTGIYGSAITFAESYELGLFENAAEIAAELGIAPEQVGELYTNAISWTAEALGAALEAPTRPPRSPTRR